MRIGTMVKQLLEEVRSTELDEKGRERLAEIHRRSIEELEEGLSAELIDELTEKLGSDRRQATAAVEHVVDSIVRATA